MTTMAMGRAIASPCRRSFSEAVAKVSLTRTFAADEDLGTRRAGARGPRPRLATASSASSSRSPARVTTTQRGASVGGLQGVSPGRPGIGDVEDAIERGDRRRARRDGHVGPAGRRRRCRRPRSAIWPPVSARSSSCWATRPDSVAVPAPKSVDSTENAALPMVAVTMRSATHDEDDGTPAAHHETSEPAHHATTDRSSGRRRRRPPGGRSGRAGRTGRRQGH